MRNQVLWVLLGLCLASGSGCAAIGDLHYRYVNCARTSSAWRKYGRPCSTESEYRRDFERGWKAGYADGLYGGPGVPPSVAPVRYMHTKYQNPWGRQAVEAWYRGFTAGTIVAEQRNVGQWNDAPGKPPKPQVPGFFAPEMPIPAQIPPTDPPPAIPSNSRGNLPLPGQEAVPPGPLPVAPPNAGVQRTFAPPGMTNTPATNDTFGRSLTAISQPPRP
ncbi:MAG TPA: hypothetical protein VG713_09965 [Pirellulales bacterium]|jgi:hypothetical protein|nr:hypothetical protein [Pirellulales bacterium]